jgi:hypothetical protein
MRGFAPLNHNLIEISISTSGLLFISQSNLGVQGLLLLLKNLFAAGMSYFGFFKTLTLFLALSAPKCHGGDCPVFKHPRKKCAGDTRAEISGHQGGQCAAKPLRRKELVPKKGQGSQTPLEHEPAVVHSLGRDPRFPPVFALPGGFCLKLVKKSQSL